jgi:hypothetical protein
LKEKYFKGRDAHEVFKVAAASIMKQHFVYNLRKESGIISSVDTFLTDIGITLWVLVFRTHRL